MPTETALHIVANDRRRRMLRYLFACDAPVPLREVVEAVVRAEDAPPSTYGTQRYRRTYTAVVQTHLPKLEAHDVVREDGDERRLVLDDVPPVLETVLEQVCEHADTRPFERSV